MVCSVGSNATSRFDDCFSGSIFRSKIGVLLVHFSTAKKLSCTCGLDLFLQETFLKHGL